MDGWDAEETLVEDQTPRSLEKAALEIVDGLCNEISIGKANGVLKGLDGLKVWRVKCRRLSRLLRRREWGFSLRCFFF